MEEKILITDDAELGHSYYVYDDDYYYEDYYYDDDYYYEDDYYDSYSSSYSYPSYSTSYYYPDYSSYYYPSYYYDNYYYRDRYYYNDYYYDDYRRRESRENRLTISGDTLKVGSNYNKNIWLNNASGRYADVRVIDAETNSHNIFIAGNSRNNSIIGGNGNPTLWGGGGSSNTLKGGARRDVFWYAGGSRDVAKNFGTGDSSYSDVVNFSNVTWSSINRDGASITFNMPDGNYMQLQPEGSSYDDDPILTSANGRDIYKMKIAQNTSTSLNYRSDIKTFYFSNPGQLMVSGSGNNIWLAGESGQYYYNVTTINGGASSGYNTLMGSSDPNVIYGGSGVSTLWGGTGVATDTLIGGEGPEIFRCGKNEGSDIVYTNQGHDVISLYDVNLSDITSAEVVGEVIAIGFNTGTFLNVHNTAEVTSIFQLSDGRRYNYNRSTNQWQGA